MEKTQEKIVTAALTRRQGDIYRYLLDHLHGFEHPPTLDVLCRALGLRSKGSLYKHIQALVLAGLVEPMNRKHRGIRLTAKRAQESTGFPLLGSIAAGRPIEAIEDPETIGIPEFFHGKINCYLLNVNGNSMAEEGILDGDRVVIERR
ncbi:MAG: LexA family protein, partial [Acidobacteriota bacterium]